MHNSIKKTSHSASSFMYALFFHTFVMTLLCIHPQVSLASESAPTVPLPQVDLQWKSAAGHDENAGAAVLICADTYLEKSWNLGHVTNNLTAMHHMLETHSSIPATSITILQGTSVNSDAIQTAIEAARKKCGDKGLLLIYFTGHAYVHKNQIHLFTHYTKEHANGGTYNNTISRHDLASWAHSNRADARRTQGNNQHILFVADACRIRTAAPPPAATLKALPLWELYSTRNGRFAEAPPPERASLFTQSFTQACKQLATLSTDSKNIDITHVFNETRRRMAKQQQEPELIAPTQSSNKNSAPNILRSKHIAFSIEVVDGISGALLPNALLRFNARATVRGNEQALAHITTIAGMHQIQIQHSGYLTRSTALTLSSQHNGSRVRIALLPSMRVISGYVSPRRAIAIHAKNIETTSIKNYHRTYSSSDKNGFYQLLLPPGISGRIVAIHKGKEIASYTLPQFGNTYTTFHIGQHQNISHFHCPPLRLNTEVSNNNYIQKTSQNVDTTFNSILPKIFATRKKTAPGELDAIHSNNWAQAMSLIEQNNYSLARKILSAIPGEQSNIWENWLILEEGRKSSLGGLHRASKMKTRKPKDNSEIALLQGVASIAYVRFRNHIQTLPPDKAETGLNYILDLPRLAKIADKKTSKHIHKQLIPLAAQLVNTLNEHNRLDALEYVCAALRRHKPWNESRSWKKMEKNIIPRLLVTLAERALNKGLHSNDWSQCEIIHKLKKRWPDYKNDPQISAIFERVAREIMSDAARKQYLHAQDEFAQGNSRNAWRAYKQAIKLGLSDYYEAFCEEQIKTLGPECAITYLNSGFEYEASGNVQQAFDCYLKAREFTNSATVHIKRLQQSPEVNDAAYQKWLFAEYALKTWARDIGIDNYGMWAELETRWMSMRFRLITNGTFLMGDPESISSTDDTHQVTLSKSYWLADTETPKAMWDSVLKTKATSYRNFDTNRNAAISNVSWLDIQKFLKATNTKYPMLKARLPSEAEWEYACRAGTQTIFSFGNTITTDMANYAYTQAAPIKTYPANSWGLYDMHGNLAEWVYDNYTDFTSNSVTDPIIRIKKSNLHVLRGGHYHLADSLGNANNNSEFTRSGWRTFRSHNSREAYNGFRIACDALIDNEK